MKLKYPLSIVLMIVITGLLSACDPLAYPYLSANRIVIANETAYLHVSEGNSWGVGGIILNEDHYFVSGDHGKTWREIDSPPIEMPPPVEDAQAVRLTACVPNDARTCYRIAGEELVEISPDGGKTWQIDWKTPPGRKQYMGKNPSITPFLKVEPDSVPYDLGIIPDGSRHIVIVAMGNQGVLVKSSNGNWERYAVAPVKSNKLASPLPYYAGSLDDAWSALSTETTWTFLLAFVFLVLLSLVGWRKLYSNAGRDSRSKFLWWGTPFILAIVGFACLIVLIVVDFFAPLFSESPVGGFLSRLISNLSLAICLIPIIGLIISWLLVAATSPNRKTGFLAAAATLGYTLLFTAGILLPFVLWAFGIIPIYEIALVVALIFGLLSVYFGYRHVRRLAISAAGQENLPMQQNAA
jgi:hypothetical protein